MSVVRAVPDLTAQLVAALGDGVRSDAATRDVMAHDVYRGGGLPLCVVRPASIAELQTVVRLCAAAGVAMVPRSGGASYSDGYLHDAGGHVVIDTGGLAAIVVDARDMVVEAGPGVTWAALRDALAPHGLRTPFWGPFSGLVATIGGSVSQNSLSHGSGAHGISAQSVLGMDVVLASGELLTTGASAATRHYGPDLTGLFTGDCGALGIKAAIRLPLIARRAHFEGVSFTFADFAAYHAAARAAQREQLDDEHFGLDQALSQGQIARHEGSRLAVALGILRAAPSKLAGVRQLARAGLAGTAALTSSAFMCHFMIEGVDAADTRSRSRRLRALLAPHGREIAATVPDFVRAVPFAPLTNILGPRGERWVPLHGVLAHSAAVPFHAALSALYEARSAELARHGIWTGAMFSPVGSTGFLYEVAIYWPDARTAYHDAALDAATLAALPRYPEALEARACVDRLKRDIVALYADHGAGHFQIGRAYPYRARLDPRADALLVAVKAALDPHGLMNPGALGLAA